MPPITLNFTAAPFGLQNPDLLGRRILVVFLDPQPRGLRRRQRRVVPITPPAHLRHQGLMPPVQGLKLAPPAGRLRVPGEPRLSSVRITHRPCSSRCSPNKCCRHSRSGSISQILMLRRRTFRVGERNSCLCHTRSTYADKHPKDAEADQTQGQRQAANNKRAGNGGRGEHQSRFIVNSPHHGV